MAEPAVSAQRLGLGGDDYVTKTFGWKNSSPRVRAVLRRTRPDTTGAVLRFADLELNQDSYEVRLAGQPVALSRTEFRLLRYLMLNTGRGAHP